MISLGLTAAGLREFHAVLVSSHSVDVVVRIVTLNGQYVADVSDQLRDGQVNIDSDADVTRNATLTLRDPNRSLAFDVNSPNEGAFYQDRMISIIYVVTSPAGKSWSVPIFYGPITGMSRDADVISLEAKGKEVLVLPPTVAWFSKSYAKGISKAGLVKTLLRDLGGETRFTFGEFTERTATGVVVRFNSNIWAICKALVGSRRYRHLFYDGRGVCVLRETPTRPCFTFTMGDGGSVVTQPQVTFSSDDVRNTVRVTGATPKGAKTPVVGIATAPRNHPLSTYNLGRNGQQRIILDEFQDDQAKTAAAAKVTAQNRLEGILREVITVTFDSMVIPHLEPEDVYGLSGQDIAMQARVKQLTIPLRGGTMSVGYNAKRSVNRARIRRRR